LIRPFIARSPSRKALVNPMECRCFRSLCWTVSAWRLYSVSLQHIGDLQDLDQRYICVSEREPWCARSHGFGTCHNCVDQARFTFPSPQIRWGFCCALRLASPLSTSWTNRCSWVG
jgi:hypothetical protein